MKNNYIQNLPKEALPQIQQGNPYLKEPEGYNAAAAMRKAAQHWVPDMSDIAIDRQDKHTLSNKG